MPRILLLHASVGSGHESAARALAEAFARKQEGEVRVEDTLSYANTLFRRAYTRSYTDLVALAPALWQIYYEQSNSEDPKEIALTNRLRGLVERLVVPRLDKLIDDFDPDATLCTHFLPAELLLRLRQSGVLRSPIYTVVTDHVAHSFWITPGIDGYFVASDLPRDLMIARGVTPAIVYAHGIPVSLETAVPKSPEAMRERYGFSQDRPLLTLFGGGIITRRVRRMVTGLLELDQPATLVVVAGRNAELVEDLADLQSGPQVELRVLGKIDYVDDLVAASDLVITKAGGLIVSEVLARGTPLLVVDPIPGQEEWNADYVVTSGAGVQLRLPESVPSAVRRLLVEPERLAGLRQDARLAGRPRAALDIAEQVLAELHSGEYH